VKRVEHVASKAEKRNAYRVLMRKPEENRLLGRPNHGSNISNKTFLKSR
jgi:hypothetical protein